MAGYGVDCDPARRLRALVLVVKSELDVDPDEVDRLVRQLRAELTDLDVESVAAASSEKSPPGAKGGNLLHVGALLVTLSATGGVFSVLIEAVRDWLARQVAAQRISVTIDGDTIELERGTARERSALIEAFIRRHEVE